MESTAADVVRVIFLVITAVLAMVCAKVAWPVLRDGSDPARVWVPATIIFLLATPIYLMLSDFGQPLSAPYGLFAVALTCGLMGMRAMFTVHPEWIRQRLAAEREEKAEHLRGVRAEQDTLRANDRADQQVERADSRALHDAEDPGAESEADREAQDENRAHSHRLQDDERATTRSVEDDRL
jgi:hypothetical protein